VTVGVTVTVTKVDKQGIKKSPDAASPFLASLRQYKLDVKD